MTSPSALDPSAASNGDADDKDLEAGGGAIMKSVSSPPLMRIDYSDVENADPNNSVDGWAESGRNHVKLLKEKRDAIEKKLKSKKNGGGDGGSTPTPKEVRLNQKSEGTLPYALTQTFPRLVLLTTDHSGWNSTKKYVPRLSQGPLWHQRVQWNCPKAPLPQFHRILCAHLCT